MECTKPLFGEVSRNVATRYILRVHIAKKTSCIADVGKSSALCFGDLNWPDTGECSARHSVEGFLRCCSWIPFMDIVLLAVALRTVFAVIGSMKTLKAFNARTSTCFHAVNLLPLCVGVGNDNRVQSGRCSCVGAFLPLRFQHWPRRFLCLCKLKRVLMWIQVARRTTHARLVRTWADGEHLFSCLVLGGRSSSSRPSLACLTSPLALLSSL